MRRNPRLGLVKVVSTSAQNDCLLRFLQFSIPHQLLLHPQIIPRDPLSPLLDSNSSRQASPPLRALATPFLPLPLQQATEIHLRLLQPFRTVVQTSHLKPSQLNPHSQQQLRTRLTFLFLNLRLIQPRLPLLPRILKSQRDGYECFTLG